MKFSLIPGLAPKRANATTAEPVATIPTKEQALASMAELERAHQALTARQQKFAAPAASEDLWQKFIGGQNLGILKQSEAHGLIEKARAELVKRGKTPTFNCPESAGQGPIKKTLIAVHAELRAAGIVKPAAEVYCKASSAAPKPASVTATPAPAKPAPSTATTQRQASAELDLLRSQNAALRQQLAAATAAPAPVSHLDVFMKLKGGEATAYFRQHKAAISREQTQRAHPHAVILDRSRKP